MNRLLLSLSRSGLVVLMSGLLVYAGNAQDVADGANDANAAAQTSAEADASPQEAPEETPHRLPFVPGYVDAQFSVSNVYDSNVDHDQEPVTSYGFVPGMVVRYRNRASKPTLIARYALARHAYTNTDKWDRVSHKMQAVFAPRLARRWYAETVGEVSLGGTSEDRDLSNQYSLQQDVEYRLTRSSRLHLYGTLRLKRFPDNPSNNAFKPHVGLVFERKLNGGHAWEAGVRYEVNREEELRGNYARWTFEAEYEMPVFGPKDELKLEIKYRRKRYDERFVEVEDEDRLRRDYRWVLGVAWERALVWGVQAGLSYKYELRDSIDPDKHFNAHLVGLTLVYAL